MPNGMDERGLMVQFTPEGGSPGPQETEWTSYHGGAVVFGEQQSSQGPGSFTMQALVLTRDIDPLPDRPDPLWDHLMAVLAGSPGPLRLDISIRPTNPAGRILKVDWSLDFKRAVLVRYTPTPRPRTQSGKPSESFEFLASDLVISR